MQVFLVVLLARSHLQFAAACAILLFMGKRIQVQKSKQKRVEELVPEIEVSSRTSDTVAEMDDLLDEIDSVLEKNAEEFVAQYIQRGGQ